MLVSVLIITYNQCKFIQQAIDSVLMQKTNFQFEIVIGDDCSNDGTRDILLTYKNRFPDIISLHLSDVNQGAMKNHINTMKCCIGKYIAFLEGDDYWTNEKKLQIQIDFLESNYDYTICFHKIRHLYKNELIDPVYSFDGKLEQDFNLLDLAKENIITTVSVVFRNNLIDKFPDWIYEVKIGDYVMHMLNAKYGKIKYLPAEMAIYRMHNSGLWSMRGYEFKSKAFIDLLDKLIPMYEEKIQKGLLTQKAKWCTSLAKFYFSKYDVESAKKYVSMATVSDPLFLQKWVEIEYPQILNNIISSKVVRFFLRNGGRVKRVLKYLRIIK